MGIALDWDADCAPQPQVCNLEALRLIVHQQVLGLEVSVHHAMLVHVGCSFDQLVHEALQADREQLRMDACASKICQCW